MQAPLTEITIRDADGTVLLQKTVPPGEYVLGREPAAELCFQADLVARRHAQLTIHDDHALIDLPMLALRIDGSRVTPISTCYSRARTSKAFASRIRRPTWTNCAR